MIDTTSRPQTPPLWPSVGALFVAGWAGSLVGSVLWAPLLGARGVGSVLGSPGAFSAAWLAPALAGALVAAAVLPRMLRAFCEFEVGLGAAFVVMLGGSLASFAVTTFVSTLLFVRSGIAVPASAALWILPQLVSFTISYLLLKRLAHPAPGTRALVSEPVWPAGGPVAPPLHTTDWSRLLAGVRAEIAQILAILARAEPKDVPAWISDALTGLEALADRVEEAVPPDAQARAPQRELVAGIRRLQGALVDLSESAWRGDHRLELPRLRGLDEIEHALAQLESADGS